jgi:hypothetical protein
MPLMDLNDDLAPISGQNKAQNSYMMIVLSKPSSDTTIILCLLVRSFNLEGASSVIPDWVSTSIESSASSLSSPEMKYVACRGEPLALFCW